MQLALNKKSFEFGLPSISTYFPKEHHSSSYSSFLSLANKIYWLVGKCYQNLFRGKVQENFQSISGNILFHSELY